MQHSLIGKYEQTTDTVLIAPLQANGCSYANRIGQLLNINQPTYTNLMHLAMTKCHQSCSKVSTFSNFFAFSHAIIARLKCLGNYWWHKSTNITNYYQRKFRNLTSDYTESCCWRSVNQEMWSRRCDTAEMCDMRFWRVGSARNAVFFHSFVASPARKVRS